MIGCMTELCQRYLPCFNLHQTSQKIGEVSSTEFTGQRNDFEWIAMVEMETRNPVEGNIGGEFPALCNHCRVMAA